MEKSTSPISLFQAVEDAIQREDWLGVASRCDPASLARFKRQLLERLEPSQPRPRLSVEEYMRVDPQVPREVAEYYVASHNEADAPERRLQDEMPTLGRTDELRQLSDAEAFAAWLEGKTPRYQLERLIRKGQIPAETAELFSSEQYLPRIRHIAIGAVPDGEKLAHILYRVEFSGAEAPPEDDTTPWPEDLPSNERDLAQDLSGRDYPQVATCRRQPTGDWLMIAEENLLGIGSLVFGSSPIDKAAPGNDAEP